MGYKIRNAQISKIPYTIVIGDDELNNQTLSVRKYNENKNEIYNIDEFVEKIVSEKVFN